MTAFLFDLDMTLVDSSRLAVWRAAQMWPRVKANLDTHVVAFETGRVSPHELPGLLKKRGYSVGVVTAAPRWYAEHLLERFEIEHDVLVAYGDTEAHKPSPEPITLALEKLGCEPKNSLYLGDDPIDFEAAYHAGAHSAGAGWGISDFTAMSVAAPDLLFRKPSVLADAKELAPRQYFGEVRARGGQPLPQWGSILRSGGTPRTYALGRYFKTRDPRHAGHGLTAKILSLKGADTEAPALAMPVLDALGRLSWTPDYIVPIPPKPDESRNRFEALLSKVDEEIITGPEVVLDGLKSERAVPDYKKMTPDEREGALKGCFSSRYDWKGGKLLLIDDVLNTGETLRETARVLKSAGADEVRAIVLGRSQTVFQHKVCPACGRTMRVRNGPYGRFWGCSGYPDHCDNTENL